MIEISKNGIYVEGHRQNRVNPMESRRKFVIARYMFIWGSVY